jgi:hypothetical protein
MTSNNESEPDSKPLTSFDEVMRELDKRPDVKNFIEGLKTFPVVITMQDGSTNDENPVYASTQEWARRHFDHFFMQWHNTGHLLFYRLAEFEAPSFPDAVAIELFDADTNESLARYDLIRE